MERSGGRSADERAAAAEERLRAREAREQGAPLEDEEPPEEQESGRGGRRPELGSMSRYGGGIDVYTRRRVVAGLVVIALIVAVFLALGGC